MQKKAQM